MVDSTVFLQVVIFQLLEKTDIRDVELLKKCI